MVEYTLIRSKRKTLGIYIMPDLRVEVRAPLGCPVSYIEVYKQKEGWIRRKLSKPSPKKHTSRNPRWRRASCVGGRPSGNIYRYK